MRSTRDSQYVFAKLALLPLTDLLDTWPFIAMCMLVRYWQGIDTVFFFFDKLYSAAACRCLSEYINRLANPSVQGSSVCWPPGSLPFAGIEAFSLAKSFHLRLYLTKMAITEWFKGSTMTLDTLLLYVYSWKLAAHHMNFKQIKGEKQRLNGKVKGSTLRAHSWASVVNTLTDTVLMIRLLFLVQLYFVSSQIILWKCSF